MGNLLAPYIFPTPSGLQDFLDINWIALFGIFSLQEFFKSLCLARIPPPNHFSNDPPLVRLLIFSFRGCWESICKLTRKCLEQ